ncbi:MAG: Asp-tRNA(Asn)/Glu-tRNA(Gln) amidotransferase subunit GatC [Patescibacteria group bacterium]
MIDIKQLSKLARIKLNAGEEKKLQKEFEDILGYVSKLKEADLTTPNPDIGVIAKNMVREDASAHSKGKFTKDLLEAASSVEKGFIKVKHVFD